MPQPYDNDDCRLELEAELAAARDDLAAEIKAHNNKRCMCSPKGFDDWWEKVGSAIRPNDGADYEEHAKRVAKAAWYVAFAWNNEGGK